MSAGPEVLMVGVGCRVRIGRDWSVWQNVWAGWEVGKS